jgi:hypothetical protein
VTKPDPEIPPVPTKSIDACRSSESVTKADFEILSVEVKLTEGSRSGTSVKVGDAANELLWLGKLNDLSAAVDCEKPALFTAKDESPTSDDELTRLDTPQSLDSD